MIELISAITGIFAVAGVILNNYRMRACFIIWFVSNAASAGIHLYSGLWSMAVRDLIFLGLAVHGWTCWSRKTNEL